MLAPCSVTIISNEQLNRNTWLLRVEAPTIAQQVEPGQFVQVRVTHTYDPLLRTPLSVHDCHPQEGTIDLLYQTVGKSTQLLSAHRKNTRLSILGPLGNGFRLPTGASTSFALLVAGGMGIAPMLLLARRLVANRVHTRLLYGARTAADMVRIDAFEKLGVVVACSTDDGSYGVAGNVVHLLNRFIQSGGGGDIFACGPSSMLKVLQSLVKERQLPAQFSLEAYMACGFGACLGCAVPIASGGYKHVCTDGPVFDAQEVAL